jgi:hypothetical protein
MRLTIKNYHKPVGCLIAHWEGFEWHVAAAVETSSNYQFVCTNQAGDQYVICLERESVGDLWAYERPAGMAQSKVSSEYFSDIKNVLSSLSSELWDSYLTNKNF